MVATTAIVGGVAHIATIAEQNDEQDNPAQITATEAVIIHSPYLRKFLAAFTAHSKVFFRTKNVTALGSGAFCADDAADGTPSFP